MSPGEGEALKDEVVQSILQQRAGGSSPIVGAMIESHLIEGRQDCRDPKALVYGQSITDACIGWEETDELLRKLAAAGA